MHVTEHRRCVQGDMLQRRLNVGAVCRTLYAREPGLIDPDGVEEEKAMMPWERRGGGNLSPITGQY